MEKVNQTISTYAQFGTFLVIWALLVFATGNFNSEHIFAALKQIPTAISLYLFIAILFTKYLWRMRFIQGWLIKIPDLQGTWRGELKSDWVDPETGKGVDPIAVVLVIRQTFRQVKCTLMTRESTSYSITADINQSHGGDDLFLAYNYTNRPRATIRERSAIHDGAAILKIIKHPKACLEGEYWTSRKTRGDIKVKFVSKELVEQFSINTNTNDKKR